MLDLGLSFNDAHPVVDASRIKACVKLRTNNKMSEQSFNRKLTKWIGFSDARSGANRITFKDEGKCKEPYEHVQREHNKCDETFQSFAKKERWNKMFIENDMSSQQVFDEHSNDEEKE